jgi:hypothetical protein
MCFGPFGRIRLGYMRITLAVLVAALAAPMAAETALEPPPWTRNCKALNAKYPHGVGKAGARDRVKGPGDRVTTFRRSTVLYNTANRHNSRLDGDNDGVACEKA